MELLREIGSKRKIFNHSPILYERKTSLDDSMTEQWIIPKWGGFTPRRNQMAFLSTSVQTVGTTGLAWVNLFH